MYRKVLTSWEKLQAVRVMVLLSSFLGDLAGWWCVKDVVGLILLMSKCSTMLPVTSSSGLCLLNRPVGEWKNKKEIQSKLFLLWNYDIFGFQYNELLWKFRAFSPSPSLPPLPQQCKRRKQIIIVFLFAEGLPICRIHREMNAKYLGCTFKLCSFPTVKLCTYAHLKGF